MSQSQIPVSGDRFRRRSLDVDPYPIRTRALILVASIVAVWTLIVVTARTFFGFS